VQDSKERIMEKITQLPTEDIRTLAVNTVYYLTIRERQDKERLSLENQDLRYKSECRLEVLQQYDIEDPFARQCDRHEVLV